MSEKKRSLADEIAAWTPRGVLLEMQRRWTREARALTTRAEEAEAWIENALPYIEERRMATKALLDEERTAGGRPSRSMRAMGLAEEIEALASLERSARAHLQEHTE